MKIGDKVVHKLSKLEATIINLEENSVELEWFPENKICNAAFTNENFNNNFTIKNENKSI